MAPGQLGERYRVEDRLGVGALTETFAAVDLEQDTHVIIEVLIAGLAHDPASVRLFNQAFQVAAALDHPTIAAVSSAQEIDGQQIVVRKVPPGQALNELIAAHGPLPADQAAGVVSDVARALAHAHQLGTTHGALSPACIYVDQDHRATVSGFGLGACTTVGLDPLYTAPERSDQNPPTPACDLYALGCCLHLMLTGQAPVKTAPSDSDPARSGASAPLLPLGLRPIVDRLLADNPEMRYRTAMAVIADLQEVTATEPTPSELPVLDSAVGSWQPGRPWEAAAPSGPETPAFGITTGPEQPWGEGGIAGPAPWHTVAEPEPGTSVDDEPPPARRHRRVLAAVAICLPLLGVGVLGTTLISGDGAGGDDGQDAVETDHDDRALVATTSTTRPDDDTTTSSTTSSTTTTSSSTTTEPPTTTSTTEPPTTEPPTTSQPPATQPPTTQTTEPPTTTTEDNRVEVPYVVNRTAWEAWDILRQRGLEGEPRSDERCYRGEQPIVEAQDPSAGRRVQPGSTVRLELSCFGWD